MNGQEPVQCGESQDDNSAKSIGVSQDLFSRRQSLFSVVHSQSVDVNRKSTHLESYKRLYLCVFKACVRGGHEAR